MGALLDGIQAADAARRNPPPPAPARKPLTPADLPAPARADLDTALADPAIPLHVIRHALAEQGISIGAAALDARRNTLLP